MHIIVYIAMHQHQVTFQLLHDFGVGSNLIDKGCIALLGYLFLYTVMGFTPPAVIDTVVMIARTRYGCFIEIGILADGCCRHKSTARMSVDTYTVDIDKRITGCQLFYCGFMVGQRIITHIAVAIVVIPLGAAWMTTALSYGNNNETGLSQTVGTYTHTGERIVNSLYLWSGIDIIDDRIYFGRIKVERFVHHTIQVGHSVGCLHLKQFRELITGCFQLREIAFLQSHDFAAVGIQQVGTRHGIHSGIVVYKETSLIVYFYLMEVIAFGELLQTAAVCLYFIEMFVIRIFVLIASVGREIDGACFFVYLQDLLHMPRSFGDAVFQIPVFIVQVQMGPSVAFAPLYQFLASLQYKDGAGFLISIHTLLNNRNNRIGSYCIGTNIYAMQVTTAAGQEEAVIVALPYGRTVFLVAFFLLNRTVFQTDGLVLVGIYLHLLAGVVCHVENKQIINRSFHFSGHLVTVAFQCRTRLRYGVDNPKFFYSTFVGYIYGKVF